MPKVSIVVPVYKVEKYLRRCVDSILTQTFTDWECILVDDGSPDGSGAICDEYAAKDARIQVIHKENGGVSSARNVGIQRASGEWISFVDSDDYLDNDSVFMMIEQTRLYDSDLFCFEYRIATDDKTIPHGKQHDATHVINSTDLIKKILLYQTNCGPYSKLFRASKLMDIRFDEGVRIGEDLLFNLHYLSGVHGPIVCSNMCVYNYYTNPESAMHSKNLFEDFALLSQKVEKFLSDDKRYEDEICVFKMINLFQPYTSIQGCPSYSDSRQMMALDNKKLTKEVHPVLYRYMNDLTVSFWYANVRLRYLYFRKIIKRLLAKG